MRWDWAVGAVVLGAAHMRVRRSSPRMHGLASNCEGSLGRVELTLTSGIVLHRFHYACMVCIALHCNVVRRHMAAAIIIAAFMAAYQSEPTATYIGITAAIAL